MLINLKTYNGNDFVVNPEFITCIERQAGKNVNGTPYNSQMWVIGNSGYQTLRACFSETPAELHDIIKKLIKKGD